MKVVYYKRGPNYRDNDPPTTQNYSYVIQPSNSPVVESLDEREWLVPGTFDDEGNPTI